MTTTALALVALVLAILAVRRQWLAYWQQRYLFELSWYILGAKLPDSAITKAACDMGEWAMLLDIGRWDYGRYVDYDLWSDVREFFSDEANLKGLPDKQRQKQESEDAELDELVKAAMAEQGLTEETLKLESGELDEALSSDAAMDEAMKAHGLSREELERDARELGITDDDINRELLAAADEKRDDSDIAP